MPHVTPPDATGARVTVKIIVIGSHQTGKSSLLRRFVHSTAVGVPPPATIGVAFESKEIDVHVGVGTVIRVILQIWDTAGSEKYRAIASQYYQGAKGCLLVFALDDGSSFRDLTRWLRDFRQLCGPEVPAVLVGNKCDLDTLEVTSEEAEAYVQAQGLKGYFQTSAKTGYAVTDVFEKVGGEAVQAMGVDTGVVRRDVVPKDHCC